MDPDSEIDSVPKMRIEGLSGGITFGGSVSLRVNASFLQSWTAIAIEREHAAHAARSEAVIAIAEDRLSESGALQREFHASTVAIVAAALAIDALYGEVKDKIAVPEATLDRWKRNRTSRQTQILETLKLGFKIGTSAKTWREDFEWLFRRRDFAVHFEARDLPLEEKHPLFPHGYPAVERIMYRVEHSGRAVAILLGVLDKCSKHPKPATAGWATDLRKHHDRFVEERAALSRARAAENAARTGSVHMHPTLQP